MDDDDALGGGQLLAVAGDLGLERGIGLDLRRGHHGIESLGLKVMEGDLVPVLFEGGNDLGCECVIEAAGLRMTEKDEDLHGGDPSSDRNGTKRCSSR